MLGFGLGTIRVLLIVPRVGDAVAVALEAPLMIGVSWIVSGWSSRHFDVPASIAAGVLMGMIAFAVLMFAELALSVLAFGRTVAAHFAAYWSIGGAIGLAAQIVFAGLPAVQARRNE
jgi:hypothetical protein